MDRWRLLAAVPAVAGGTALAAWQGTLSRTSSAGHLAVLATIATGIVAAGAAGRRRQQAPSRAWLRASWRAVARWRRAPNAHVAGVAGWVVLVATAVGWDLNSFLRQAHDLPTLSILIGHVTAVPAGRGLLFAVWLALGAAAVLVGRRKRPAEHGGRLPGRARARVRRP